MFIVYLGTNFIKCIDGCCTNAFCLLSSVCEVLLELGLLVCIFEFKYLLFQHPAVAGPSFYSLESFAKSQGTSAAPSV